MSQSDQQVRAAIDRAMTPPPTPIRGKAQLRIEVVATLRSSNGTEIEVNTHKIILSKPGPNGGRGNQVELAIADWDVLHAAVVDVREALAKHNEPPA